ncbi:hypothetical protein EDB86DRAFT_1978055 [Lactarius hatsudake]|nr:hypothetical protein EDB86DRAFT_1978055 [Lactarius hatsudake]
MYLEMSLREDKEMVEGWNQDAKSILLFSGLFSATVAAALGPSLPDLVVNSQDVSSVYLEHIYEILASFNGSQPDFASINSELDVSSVPFQLVNSLWFLSLILSLTCALMAILLQQWARRYFMAIRQRGTLYSQARVREFLAEGVRNSGIAILVDIMRAFHHLSFMLFLGGLLVYFYYTDYSTFTIILFCSCSGAILYLLATILGILRENSPYYTPFSSILHRSFQLTLLSAFMIQSYLAGFSILGGTLGWTAASDRVEAVLGKLTPKGMEKATENSARQRSKDLDKRTLEWTFNSLNKDHEFERFFAGIPDFCNSRAVERADVHLRSLDDKQKLSRALTDLMHRTATSPLISESDRQRRIKICAKVIDAVPTLVSWSTLRHVFGVWEAFLVSVDFGRAVLRTGDDHNSDPRTVFCAQCITAIVIARAWVHDRVQDYRWIDLTTRFLTSDMKLWIYISQPTLQSHLEHRYRASLQIANLIFVTRAILQFYSQHRQVTSRDTFDISSKTLIELSSKIEVQGVSSDLQHEYCDLWNRLVSQARAEAQAAEDGTRSYTPKIAADILGHLRKVHIALHENTDASLSHISSDDNDHFSPLGSSYPLCSRTSPQAPSLINTDHNDTPLCAPQNATPADAAGATEGATPGPNVASSTPEPPSPPTNAHSRVEPEMENVQQSYGQAGTPPSIVIDSLLSSPSNAPVDQPLLQLRTPGLLLSDEDDA